jgi:quinol monooxygenase YgiN
MFARVVKCQSKSGRIDQLGDTLCNDVLPMLQKQPGFVDFLALYDKTDPEKLLCISFWTSREDAEGYHRRHYDAIADTLRAVVKSPPTLETFGVSVSTVHRIVIGRTA